MQIHTEQSSHNIQKFVDDKLESLLRLKEALDLPNGDETILDQILFVEPNKSTNQKQSKQLLKYLSSNEYDTDAIKYDLIDIYNAHKKSNISNHISNSDWIRNSMVKKTYKTPAMLLSECTNCLARDNKTDIYTHCKSIQRISVILKAYNKIINSKLYGKISLSNTLKFKHIYTLTEINNDYLHIKDHIDDNSINRHKLLDNMREHIQITSDISRSATRRTTDNIHSELCNIEDIIVEKTCVKIISYLTQYVFRDLPQPTHTYNKPYIGKKEDDEWWDIDIDMDEKKDKYEMDEIIYRELIRKMKIFRWQCSYGFNSKQHQGLMHLKARFSNIKEEILYNPYYALSKDNWNQTLRKSQVFCNSFARRRIQTSSTGKYDDKIIQKMVEWKKGEIINLMEIVIFKLYTDFDKLQFELKRCFRFDTFSDIFTLNNFGSKINNNKNEFNDKNERLLLEYRLSIFYWWRIKLLTVLNKYSQPMNPKIPLFHGVNCKMILNITRNGLSFFGPLSTSISYHVARTFATAKGMVLELNSQFPKLGICRVFDASLLSDYPEEREQLVSFAYLRIKSVLTRPLNKNWISFNDMDNKKKEYNIPLSSKTKSICFAVHLFRQQIFSMSLHLEYWLSAFLYLDCKYNQKYDNKDNQLIRKTKFVNVLENISDNIQHKDNYNRILNILKNKFNNFRKFPNQKQVIKIDEISNNLKPYFMDFDGFDIHKKYKYIISFGKICKIFENVKEIQFINSYLCDKVTINNFLTYVYNNPKTNLKKIKFLYYDYDKEPKESIENHLGEIIVNKLSELNWKIRQKSIGKIGYEIKLCLNGKRKKEGSKINIVKEKKKDISLQDSKKDISHISSKQLQITNNENIADIHIHCENNEVDVTKHDTCQYDNQQIKRRLKNKSCIRLSDSNNIRMFVLFGKVMSESRVANSVQHMHCFVIRMKTNVLHNAMIMVKMLQILLGIY